MNSVFFRVDDRLVHGQIVESWVKFLNAAKIIVIDDKVVNDPVYKSAIEIAVPFGIKILILTVKDSVKEIDSCLKNNERTIALFSNLEDVYNAVSLGLKVKILNLGGLRFVNGKKTISKTVFLNEHEMEILGELFNLGVKVNIQSIPSETAKDIQQMLNENFKT